MWYRTRKRQHYIDRIPLRNIGCKRALTTLDQTHGGTRVLLSVLHNQLPRPPLDHRTPLLLEGSDSDIDLNVELAAGLYTDVYPQADDINEQLELGERFSTLDSGDDNDSSTGGGEGGGIHSSGGDPIASRPKVSAIRIMDQFPLEKSRRTNENRSHQMPLDTLHYAAISGISNRLAKPNYCCTSQLPTLFYCLPRFVGSPYGPSQC